MVRGEGLRVEAKHRVSLHSRWSLAGSTKSLTNLLLERFPVCAINGDPAVSVQQSSQSSAASHRLKYLVKTHGKWNECGISADYSGEM